MSHQEGDNQSPEREAPSSSSYVSRLTAPHKANNNRETIARMSERIIELETENRKLAETVEWMHQAIWDLVRKTKKLKIEDQETSDKPV